MLIISAAFKGCFNRAVLESSLTQTNGATNLSLSTHKGLSTLNEITWHCCKWTFAKVNITLTYHLWINDLGEALCSSYCIQFPIIICWDSVYTARKDQDIRGMNDMENTTSNTRHSTEVSIFCFFFHLFLGPQMFKLRLNIYINFIVQ